MTGRRPRVWLDWSHRSHATSRRGKCRHCGRPTWLLDDDGEPSHKVCAERALEEGRIK